jgi:hypothetical protein
MRYEGLGCFRLKTKEITRTVLALFTADIALHFKIARQTRKVRELVRQSQKNRMANMLKLIFTNHDPEVVRFHGVPRPSSCVHLAAGTTFRVYLLMGKTRQAGGLGSLPLR